MKSTFTFYSVCLGLAFFFCFSAEGQRLVGKHSPDQAYEYNVFLPEGYEQSTEPYPVIVYLHGGNGVREVTDINDFSKFNYGIPVFIYNKLENNIKGTAHKWSNNDFVVVVPHLYCNTFDEGKCVNENDRLWEVDSLNKTILDFKNEFASEINQDKIYLTGISLGAKGVWDYSLAYPDVPAAIVPISGNVKFNDIDNLCNDVEDMPIWAFHGDADRQVNPYQSPEDNDQGRSGIYSVIDMINDCENQKYQARLTKLLFKAHESGAWDPIYDLSSGYDIYGWMLKHDKSIFENIPPFVHITQADQDYLWNGEPIMIKLQSDAFDSDGDPLSYKWSLVQGLEANVEFLPSTLNEEVFVKFKAAGDYTIQLAVSDGEEVFDEVEINILETKSSIQVVGFDLYNGDNNTRIRSLSNGEKIDTEEEETENINIKAIINDPLTNDNAVRFSINQDQNFRTISYNNSKDADGNVGNFFLFPQLKEEEDQPIKLEWTPDKSEYIITATPYLNKNPARNPGISSNFVIYVNEEPDPIILPVEFVNVSAKREVDKITVSWLTASENGNDFFTIERSSSANEAFDAIGTVEGAGDSKTVRKYNFNDHNPLGRKAYYRIKQTDFDGKSDYSKIVSVAGSNQFEISLFPNPSERGHVHLRLSSADFYTEVNVQLFDAIGNQYFSDSFSPEVLFNEEGYLLSKTKSLKAGMYFVIISQGENKVQRKLVVK